MALTAHAATECEQNYSSRPSADGGTIHHSFVGLYGADTAQATTSLESSARNIGSQSLGEPRVATDGLVTMAVAQKASVKARGFPIVMAVSPRTASAIIAFQVVKGVTAATAMRNICSFFDAAGRKGATANASGKRSVANAQLGLPLLGSLDGTLNDAQAARDTAMASQAVNDLDAAEAANARGTGHSRQAQGTCAHVRLRSEGGRGQRACRGHRYHQWLHVRSGGWPATARS